METKGKTKEQPESEEIRMERAHQHAKTLAKAYRETMVKDLTGAPDHMEKRLLCGALAMEYLDISTDLFALAIIRAASEADGLLGTILKLKEIMNEGVDNYGEASKQFLLIALRNAIQKGVLEAPKEVNKALAEALDEYINVREKAAMDRSDSRK